MSNLFNAYDHRIGWLNDMGVDEDISAWDTSGVTTMKSMFSKQPWFNQPIGKWQTSAVKDMSKMFDEAKRFNQDLGGWDIGAVTKMGDIFEAAKAFDQDLGWCVQHECGLIEAFHGSGCKSTACGVAQKDIIGICDPWARPCLIAGKDNRCYITSPTFIIMIMLVLLGAGAYVHRRKKEDETYVVVARRLLCCRRCQSKMESSSVTSPRPDSPAESPRDEPDEEATAEKTKAAESVEPWSFSKKLTSFFFGEQEEPPTEDAQEEEAAALPVFAEAEEAPTEQPPPPPPARRWFSRADPEPSAPIFEEMYNQIAAWYNGPENAALRARWGPFPEPEEFQTWPGFVRVTNAFLDARSIEP